MDPNKQREIASHAGKAADVKGTAHEWNRELKRVVRAASQATEAGASGDGPSVGCTKGTVRR